MTAVTKTVKLKVRNKCLFCGGTNLLVEVTYEPSVSSEFAISATCTGCGNRLPDFNLAREYKDKDGYKLFVAMRDRLEDMLANKLNNGGKDE